MLARLVKVLRKKGGFEGFLWNELRHMPGFFLVVTDASFVLEWANDFFYEYFNCRPEDVEGQAMHGFLGEDIRGDMSEEHIERLLEAGYVWDHPARTTGADGEFVLIRWNQRVFVDDDGKKWILSVGITERKDTIVPGTAEREWKVKPKAELNQAMPKHDKSEQEPDLDIKRLISRENIVLHYQPRVNARNKHIIGAEGLVRMVHPERGLIYPAGFLPGLEDSDDMIKIGAYVADAACKKLLDWRNVKNGMSISINVSPRQFCDADFVQSLLVSTARFNVEPSQLMLEMTEHAIASHFQQAERVIGILKDVGFKVAIDEYSTAFLPLPYLVQLAVDDIAIDRDCLMQANHNPAMYTIMESIILLAHGLNKTVTARGVENRKQLDFLLDNSVDFLQGYLISEPLPEAEFDRFLKTNPDFYTRHI